MPVRGPRNHVLHESARTDFRKLRNSLVLLFLPFAHSTWYAQLKLAIYGDNYPSTNQPLTVMSKSSETTASRRIHGVSFFETFTSPTRSLNVHRCLITFSVDFETGGMARSDPTDNQS